MRMLFGASAAAAGQPASEMNAAKAAAETIRPTCRCMFASSLRMGRRAVARFSALIRSPRPITLRQTLRPLERVGARLLLDGHPLPMGERLPIGATADSRPIAGRADAAERDMRLVGDRLVVDVQKAGVQPIADGDGAPEVRGEHAGREPVLTVVGERDRLVVSRKGGDRCNRTEHLL